MEFPYILIHLPGDLKKRSPLEVPPLGSPFIHSPRLPIPVRALLIEECRQQVRFHTWAAPKREGTFIPKAMYLAGILCSLCYFCRHLCLKRNFSHPGSTAKLLLWLDQVTTKKNVSLPKTSRWAGAENKGTNMMNAWNHFTKVEGYIKLWLISGKNIISKVCLCFGEYGYMFDIPVPKLPFSLSGRKDLSSFLQLFSPSLSLSNHREENLRPVEDSSKDFLSFPLAKVPRLCSLKAAAEPLHRSAPVCV